MCSWSLAGIYALAELMTRFVSARDSMHNSVCLKYVND